MQSLRSRDFVTLKFSWQWYFYTITSDGIEYLREYLHIPMDVVPATFAKSPTPASEPSFGRDRLLQGGDGSKFLPYRPPSGVGLSRDGYRGAGFRPEFEGAVQRRGFGRGRGRAM